MNSNLLLRDDFLQPNTSDEIRRLIILDAPNLMHMTKTRESERNKVNAAGLLAVMRYFFKNDFDVIAVSQRKYARHATVSHKFAVDQLEVMGLIYLAEGHTLDDIVALEMAYTTDGVVVSNDQFEDHMQLSQRFSNVCDRCVSITIQQVKPSEQHSMSSNNHYIAEHIFRFHRRVLPPHAPNIPNSTIPTLHEPVKCRSQTEQSLRNVASRGKDFSAE